MLGKEFVIEAEPSMGGDDFAYFAEKVPSSYFFVGIAPKGSRVVHHSPYFQWDDRMLRISSGCLCRTAVDFLTA
jgi:amidohydrolase